MFIDRRGQASALRQEGHVQINTRPQTDMALLTEGDRFMLAGTINMALLTEGRSLDSQRPSSIFPPVRSAAQIP